jgi:alpha-beta hydrolase superfamily lysophospholipase
VLAEQPGSAQAEATPFWFGPGDRELFGWLHLPADRVVRGGVVLCQPLGIEAICVYFSYRLLAERLAQCGLAVLRFDYDGTGDSSGVEDDPDRLDAWLESVSAATDALVALGADTVGLVGVRIGALFAAHEATRRDGVDALVLWDPCLSGRSFLREQRFLRLLSGTGSDQDDEAVDAPGLRFEPETVKALSDLDLGRLPGSLARRTLVLIPPDVSRPRSLERRLEGTDVDWQEATGQDLLLDSSLQEPPLATIGRVTEWLCGALGGEPTLMTPPDRPSAIVSQTPIGEPVVERTVRLGPLGLFGIVTEPGGPPRGPTVVLVNEGNTHHIGQARIWVDLARRVAAAGFRVLRFDLSGIGDSNTRPGQRAHVSRAPEAIEDVYEAMRAIRPEDPTDVVLVGFCSGAYEVIEQALAHPPRGICVINPTFSFLPPEPAFTAERPGRQYTKRWFARPAQLALRWVGGRRGSVGLDRWSRALEVGTWPVAIATRHPGIPPAVWWFVNRALMEHPGIGTLERIVGEDVNTLLVSGPGDLLPVSIGSERRLGKLQEDPNFQLVVLDELDHASWVKGQRRRLIEVQEEFLVNAFGGNRADEDRPA